MSERPHFLAHRKRLRERFLKTDGNGLQDYELMELLLTYAIPRRDIKPFAKNVIKHFGGLTGALDASIKDIEKIHGLGPSSAILIRLVKELLVSYMAERIKCKDVLSSPEAVLEFSRLKLSGIKNEAFMTIYVNVKNEIIEYELLNEGTIDNVVIYPRRIIEGALSHHASGLILVHNHPSGNPEPSEDDRNLTLTMYDTAKTLDIRLLDHIIVGRGGYFSFREKNLLV